MKDTLYYKYIGNRNTNHNKENGGNNMSVVISSKATSPVIYHKRDCKYVKKIQWSNRMYLKDEDVRNKQYKECKCCSTISRDVMAHENTFSAIEQRENIKFTFISKRQTLFIQTNAGFWKIWRNTHTNKYMLYHLNKFYKNIKFEDAAHGEFHRQGDAPTGSLDKIINYIISHDKAKIIMMDDYKKLPQRTKTQKRYFKAAKKKADKRKNQQIDRLFAQIEEKENIKHLSYC